MVLDKADGLEEPEAFEATTVNLYAVPTVNPVTGIDEPVELLPEPPTGDEVTVYKVAPMEEEQDTVAVVGPVVVAVGVPEGANGYVVMETEEADGLDEPDALEATTVNV